MTSKVTIRTYNLTLDFTGDANEDEVEAARKVVDTINLILKDKPTTVRNAQIVTVDTEIKEVEVLHLRKKSPA